MENTPKIKYLIESLSLSNLYNKYELQIMTHAVSSLYPKTNQCNAQNAMELELFIEFNVQRRDEVMENIASYCNKWMLLLPSLHLNHNI